ncbi:hypothetical protein GGR42_002251 [Saonia flava]|uniref:WD40-like Beta Propeller Repeat n=1 Tax=Saonia flava TaxID=523696 RepID=A0A846R4R2_9FLAO|nr:PD40 domain-containing protein [Saonia flava]NJB71789.1 hypothetical protein [Saonia flava]
MFKRLFLILLLFISGCSRENSLNIALDIRPTSLELYGKDIVSTNLYERDIAISSKGDEIIYSLGNYDQTIRSLVIIEKKGKGWTNKKILDFSGKYNDIEPFFSPDGEKLYFSSNRPIYKDSLRNDYNIWVAEKINLKWGNPMPLDSIINSKTDEFYPAVSKHGNLYFTSSRENGIGREDIFISKFVKDTFEAPTVLDANINTAMFEFNAYINPEENLLIFSSFGREDGYGGGDLYYSTKNEHGEWSKSKNMGAIVNSDKLDYCPFIDLPRKNFYFTSNKGHQLNKKITTILEFNEMTKHVLNGMGNIYRIDVEKLNIE